MIQYFKSHQKELIVYVLAGVFVAILINLKLFFVPGLYGFDLNGEATDAFPGLKIAKVDLARGHFPLMNIFKNFGTPILGDCLTMPLAPHSLTYFFLPPYLASTVNRTILAILTIPAICLFLRSYMSFGAALFSSLVVFGTSGYFHSFAHHHFHASLLYFVVGLIFEDLWKTRKTASVLLCLQASITLLFASTNLNVYMIFLGVMFLWFVSGEKEHIFRNACIFSGMMVLGLLFVYADFYLFIVNIADSLRIEYDHGLDLTKIEFLRALMGYLNPKVKGVLETYVYLAIPAAACTLYGLFWLMKDSTHRSLGWRILLIAFVPSVIVFTLVCQVHWQRSIPLVRSTEITRILWATAPILGIALGKALDLFEAGSISKTALIYMLTGVLVWMIGQFYLVSKEQGLKAFLLPNIAFTGWLILSLTSPLIMQRKHFAGLTLGAIIAWSQVVNDWNILGYWSPLSDSKRTSHYFSFKELSEFYPGGLLDWVPCYSRVASVEPSNVGHDQRTSGRRIFGSAGRGIILDRDSSYYFLKNNLATIDELPFSYHFNLQEDAFILNKLGIGYLIVSGKEAVDHPDWQPMGYYEINQFPLYLLKSKKPFSLAYFTTSTKDVLNISPPEITFIENNRLHWSDDALTLDLQSHEQNSILVVTLANRFGWTAKVDGTERKIVSHDDHFIRIPLHSGDKHLELEFKPFSSAEILLYMVISVFLTCLVWPRVPGLLNKAAIR